MIQIDKIHEPSLPVFVRLARCDAVLEDGFRCGQLADDSCARDGGTELLPFVLVGYLLRSSRSITAFALLAARRSSAMALDSVVLPEPGDPWSTSTSTPFTARM